MQKMQDQEKTIKNTKQKELVFNCLKNHASSHLTSFEIESILRKEKTPVSKATIYRCLTKLEKAGFIRKYKLDNNSSSCYQYINHKACYDHFHLVCEVCSKTEHFKSTSLSETLIKINLSNIFSIDSFKTLFYGTCSDCKKKMKGI